MPRKTISPEHSDWLKSRKDFQCPLCYRNGFSYQGIRQHVCKELKQETSSGPLNQNLPESIIQSIYRNRLHYDSQITAQLPTPFDLNHDAMDELATELLRIASLLRLHHDLSKAFTNAGAQVPLMLAALSYNTSTTGDTPPDETQGWNECHIESFRTDAEQAEYEVRFYNSLAVPF